jgi:hypothetical protein
MTSYAAGDPITWTQFYAQDGPETRTGTVWSECLLDTGLANAWWVIPDEPRPGETLASGALCVGRSSRRDPHHSADPDYPSHGPARGQVYASTRPADSTAHRTVVAWRATREIAEANAARRCTAAAV